MGWKGDIAERLWQGPGPTLVSGLVHGSIRRTFPSVAHYEASQAQQRVATSGGRPMKVTSQLRV